MDKLHADDMIVLDSVGKVNDTCLVLEDLLDVLDIVPSITITKLRNGYLSGNLSKQHDEQSKVKTSEQDPGCENSLSSIEQCFLSDESVSPENMCATLPTRILVSAPQQRKLNTAEVQDSAGTIEQDTELDDSLSIIDHWFASDDKWDKSRSVEDSKHHTLSTPVTFARLPVENRSSTTAPPASAPQPLKVTVAATVEQSEPEKRKSAASPKSLVSTSPQINGATANHPEEKRSVAFPIKENEVANAKQPMESIASLQASDPEQNKQNDGTTTTKQPEENKSVVSAKSLVPATRHKQNDATNLDEHGKNKSAGSHTPLPCQAEQELNQVDVKNTNQLNEDINFSESLALLQREQNGVSTAKEVEKNKNNTCSKSAPSRLTVPIPKGRKGKKNKYTTPLLQDTIANPKRPQQSKPASRSSPLILGPKQPQQNSKQQERDDAVPSLLSLPLLGPKSKKPVHCPKRKRCTLEMLLENEWKQPKLNGYCPFKALVTSTKGQNQKRSTPSLLSLPLVIPKPHNQTRSIPSVLSQPLEAPEQHNQTRSTPSLSLPLITPNRHNQTKSTPSLLSLPLVPKPQNQMRSTSSLLSLSLVNPKPHIKKNRNVTSEQLGQNKSPPLPKFLTPVPRHKQNSTTVTNQTKKSVASPKSLPTRALLQHKGNAAPSLLSLSVPTPKGQKRRMFPPAGTTNPKQPRQSKPPSSMQSMIPGPK